MSKTDKTRPYWVKLHDDYRVRIEIHNHEDGICNFDEWYTKKDVWPRKCGYTVSYYGWNEGFFARGPARWLKAEVKEYYGSERGNLRKDIHNMLKLSREDVEDYDVINPRHRHGALWNS
jgi:hypothetical protein